METGKPEMMKKLNTTLIYQALIKLHSATRSELSEATKISTTTIRSLIEELLADDQIVAQQLDKSSGGRRALRYVLNPNKNSILSFYWNGDSIIYRISSLTGTMLESGERRLINSKAQLSVISANFILELQEKLSICAVGLGVPGIVKKGLYYSENVSGNLYANNIGDELESSCGLPVILENDLNAIAYGFSERLSKTDDDSHKHSNLAYIHFNEDCSGAGLIVDGKVVHGANGFAGELGFLPIEGKKTLDDVLKSCKNNDEFSEAVAHIIADVSFIINPSVIVIGGERVNSENITSELLSEHLEKYIYEIMHPDIIITNQYSDDYLSGLTSLTLNRIVPMLPL